MSDAATATAPTQDTLGTLPEWNLADLYAGPDAPDLKRDLDGTEAGAIAFRDRYQGKLATLDGGALGAAIAEYEKMDEVLARIMSYASLVYAGNMYVEAPRQTAWFNSATGHVHVGAELRQGIIEVKSVGVSEGGHMSRFLS